MNIKLDKRTFWGHDSMGISEIYSFIHVYLPFNNDGSNFNFMMFLTISVGFLFLIVGGLDLEL